ncbi:MAG: glycoside hydrolase family 95 protein [Caulobacteraceae bacterium]|nr:glycoside hydrolase family 95 protein [Caulobacteraceae bacterium]
MTDILAIDRRAALGLLGSGLGVASAGPALAAAEAEARSPHVLWYRSPALEWTEALPVGNGKTGAMVFGGVARERLQLNDSSLWAGGPYSPANPEALAALPEVRRLVFEGRYPEAQTLAQAKMMADPIRQMSYQTVGDLFLTFGVSSAAGGYRRELDLDQGIAATRFVRNGVTYSREVLASAAAGALVVRLTADRPGALSFEAEFETPQEAATDISDGDLVLRGANTAQNGVAAALTFEARVRVLNEGGTVERRAGSLAVSGADAVTLIIATETSFQGPKTVAGVPERGTRAAVEAAARRGWPQLRALHVAEHRQLFRRFDIDLGQTDPAALSTDQRIAKSQTLVDPALAALYVQYARYLLISCSRPGGQPATLQGLWNDKINPPWGSKYTININTEMNYWPAEPANLAPCVEPLVEMVRQLSATGAEIAKVHYGARGWVCHHNTDLWRAAAPIDGARFGMWPMGGAWLCLHLWDRWDYGRDKAYLADVWPLMRDAALFFVDFLVADPATGELVTCPSLSPENLHPHDASVCAGPAMDSQILRDLFTHCIAASEILGVDADLRRAFAETRAKLPKDRIGSGGQLQEWREDWDLTAPEPNHRHVSHLYAVYPSRQINVLTTPELATAAKKSLDLRGDLSTGWAVAWRINLWARLREGERAHSILALLLGPERTYPNMFDAHPPFQIDGNFGGASAVLEMLVQQLDDHIDLLPALPTAWPEGSVRGLRLRGGREIDLAWREGRPTAITLRGPAGETVKLRHGQTVRSVVPGRGPVQLDW